jgi:hypothetical protein
LGPHGPMGGPNLGPSWAGLKIRPSWAPGGTNLGRGPPWAGLKFGPWLMLMKSTSKCTTLCIHLFRVYLSWKSVDVLAVRACSRREAFVHISLHVSSTRNVVDAFVQIPEKLADLHGKYKASFIHMAS